MTDINQAVENARKMAAKGAQPQDLSDYFKAAGFTDEQVIEHINRGKAGTGPLAFADNLIRQAAGGITFGFADEIAAGLDAPFNALTTDNNLGQAYEQRLNYHRGRDKAFAELYPKSALAANVAGGIGTAIATGGTSLPATIPGAIARGAGQGALYGGLSGFGTGEGGLENRLGNAAMGAGVGAVLGGGLSGLFAGLGPYVQRAWRAVVSRAELFDPNRQQLTEAGRWMLQQAGFDASQMSDDAIREFARQARAATDPAQVGRVAEAATLPVPVQLTQGQVTLRPGQQMTEDLMMKGALGQPASTIMQAAQQQQQQAIRGNLPAIQGQLGGGLIEKGAGGAAAQAALVGQREGLEEAVSQGYQAARAAPGGGFAADAVDDIGARLSQSLAMNYTAGTIPKAEAVLADFGRLTNAARGGVGNVQSQGNANVLVKAIFDWRARANATWKAADATERGAIRNMITQVDDFIEQSIDDALFQGDEAAVRAWQGAIAARRELGQQFQTGDLIEALTTQSPRGGEMALKVAPEDAANYIFGASNTGWLKKPNLARDLMRMRGMLPDDAWNALRQEAFLRFARAGEGAMEGGTRQFSGANFSKAWADALTDNAPLMRILFNEGERRLISQFANVAARATNPVRGGQNFSNTTAAASMLGQSVMQMLGPRVMTWMTNTPGLMTLLGGINAVRASRFATGVPVTQLPSTAVPVGMATGLITTQGQARPGAR